MQPREVADQADYHAADNKQRSAQFSPAIWGSCGAIETVDQYLGGRPDADKFEDSSTI